jgi:hypothetical protein
VKTAEFPSLSDYSYVAGNPLMYIDPDGRDLHLAFESQEAKTEYVQLVNKSLGSQFEVRLVELPNNDGTFTHSVSIVISSPGGEFSKMTAKEEAFFFIYKGVITDEALAKQTVVMNSPDADVGDFRTNALDIGDIQKFDKAGKGAASSAGALIHETVEQLEKSKQGVAAGKAPKGGRRSKIFKTAHAKGTRAENAVNGNKRDEKTGVFTDKNGKKTKQDVNTDYGDFEVTKTEVK